MKKFTLVWLIIIGVLVLGTGILYWKKYKPFDYQKIYSTSSQQKSESKQNTDLPDANTEVSFMAVGDIMLSRNVAGQIAKNNKDGNYPFRKLSSYLASTDFNFGNLESPYSGEDHYNPTGSLVFNAPTWTLSGLTKNNFRVLNLANNHGFDQGLDSLLYTKQLLLENNILSLGVGKNLKEAWEGQVHTVKDVRVGFIGASYASLNDNGATTNDNVARIEQTAKLTQSINELKTRSDFIVVTMHAGTEYVRNPNASQTKFAKAAIDAGADLVIGAHPHWIQTIELYKGKYIFYSLGNFVFDQMWSQDTREGLMLKIDLQKDPSCQTTRDKTNNCGMDSQGNLLNTQLKQIELLPVIIEDYSTPRIANEQEKESILKKIDVTSAIIKP